MTQLTLKHSRTLLPSRPSFFAPWKHALAQIADVVPCKGLPSVQGVQHVFIDGTAECTGTPFDLAAWGCVNAMSGAVVATGPLPGLTQNNDRAELYAILQASRWQSSQQVDVHLWIDAKWAADGFQYLHMHGFAGRWAHQDLWEDIGAQLGMSPELPPCSTLDSQPLECR